MNILIVIADLGLGGAQQVVVNLANEFTRRGNQVWLFDVFPELRKTGVVNRISKEVNLITPDFLIKPKNLFEKAINSILWKTGISRNFLKQKRAKEHLKKLKKICKKEKIYIVNSHVWWADLFVFENLPELHGKWWITFHGSYSFLLKNPQFFSGFEKKGKDVVEAAKGIIYLSDEELFNVKTELKPNFSNFHKVYNGIPIPEVSGKSRQEFNLEEKDFIITCASRAVKEKGWEELIEAVAQLYSKYQKIKLLLIGDGPMLKDWRAAYGGLSFVEFMGYREDVLDLIAISDLVVLASYSEALPTVLIEAISLGVPVVATNRGETKEILNYGNEKECGILLSEIPIIDNIVDTMDILISNPNLINNFKLNTFTHSKKFQVREMVDSYFRLFNNF